MLASAESEAEAYPALLAAIGSELGCAGALWLPREDGQLHCAQAWPMDAAAAGDLAPGVWERGRPDAHSGPPAAFAFPLPGVGVMGFSTAAPLVPDATLLATMDSLGSQISQFVQRCRAQADLRESDARKSAILNAAFDCIITMDHHGNVVEVNRATERTFGYRAGEMIGRELAELIVPPGWREAHREGLERFVRTGRGALGGHPVEAQGMRKDRSEFPVELIVTRADLPGPPLFCGYLRDVTETRERERDLRRLATEQAALRRVATAVADQHRPAAHVRGRHRGGRAAARCAELEHDPVRRRAARDRRRRLERGRRAERAGGRHGPDGRRHRLDAGVPDGRARPESTATRRSRASSPRGCAPSGSRAPSRHRSSSAGGCGAP